MENKLNLQYPQVHWEVFNFGVSGANTAQELNLYRELVRKYNMDIIVCAYYNGNDFSDNSLRLGRSPGIYMDFKEGSDELATFYPAPSRKKFPTGSMKTAGFMSGRNILSEMRSITYWLPEQLEKTRRSGIIFSFLLTIPRMTPWHIPGG